MATAANFFMVFLFLASLAYRVCHEVLPPRCREVCEGGVTNPSKVSEDAVKFQELEEKVVPDSLVVHP
jgi:hypothetical protein